MVNLIRILHCGICHGKSHFLKPNYDYCSRCGGLGKFAAVAFVVPHYLRVNYGRADCNDAACGPREPRFDPFVSRPPLVQGVAGRSVDWPTRIQLALATKARTTPELAAKFNRQGKHVLKRLHEARKKGLVTCSGVHPLTWRLA